jgi:hypothetical protein
MPAKRFSGVLVLFACAAALLPASAGAATVTNGNDSGPGSLRQVVAEAAPGETVSVPAGVYTLTSGPIAIEKSLTINGAGTDATRIRGGDERTFTLSGAGNSVTLSNLALRENVVSESIIQGGVIKDLEASLTLDHVLVAGITADSRTPGSNGGIIQGGAIFAVGAGTLTIRDSSIQSIAALAQGDSGSNGGIVQGGAIFALAESLVIERSTLAGVANNARGGQGPTSSSQNGGIVQGGALIALGVEHSLGISGSTISGNTSDARPGAGASGGIIQGAGIYLGGSPGSLVEDTIASNSGTVGGSGIAQGGNAFLGSTAEGKVLAVQASTIANGTVDGQSGTEMGGGNLFMGKGETFTDTIVSGGHGPSGAENCALYGEGSPTSIGFNLDSSDQCGFHAGGDLVNQDPQLGPLQNNGGETQTMMPAISSPAVDRGTGLGLASDQRGAPRPIDFPSIPNAAGGDGSDIGAVEVQAPNSFAFGKLVRNKKKGTAKLTVTLPTPNAGTLSLAGKAVKARTLTLNGSTASLTIPIVATGKARKALKRKGKRKVAISVTFQAPGQAATTQTRTVKLVKKLHRHHKRHHHKR